MTVVDYALGVGVHVEVLATSSSAGTFAVDLTGNEIGQEIVGNAGSNVIDGKGGNDTLRGGSGKDYFVFSAALGAGNLDSIADFSAAADAIRLDKAVFAALTVSESPGGQCLQGHECRCDRCRRPHHLQSQHRQSVLRCRRFGHDLRGDSNSPASRTMRF